MEKDSTAGGTKLSAALKDAENIIEGAKSRARELVADAEKIKLEAKEQGFKEGFVAAQIEVAKSAVRMMEDRAKLNDMLSEEAANLATSICASIIEAELSLKPEIVKSIAQKALKEAVVGNFVELKVNPADQQIIERHRSELEQMTSGLSIKITSDDKMPRGGCRVVSEFGEVDATITSLVEAIKDRH